MTNDWFRFKQFTIHQAASAMKVGTDGVLLGSWTNLAKKDGRILDVGTGTGLIALMLAQRFPDAEIHGIDIDNSSCSQARENIAGSAWSERILIHQVSFQNFIRDVHPAYHLIVSNPPYFSDSLQGPAKQRNQARHQISLKPAELISGSVKLLDPESGRLSLIIPYLQKKILVDMASEVGLFPNRILDVRARPGMEFIRSLLEFSFLKHPPEMDELCIELNSRHEYSVEYKNLTREFYLKF